MASRHGGGHKFEGLKEVDPNIDPENQSPASSAQITPAEKKKDETSDEMRGYFFMACLALQYGMQPLLTKECIGPEVMKSTIVVVQEVSKFCIAFVMLYGEGGMASWREHTKTWTLMTSLQIAAVPSCLYAVQNILLFYAAGNMDPLSFNLVNQTKLIWTAFFVFIIMQKKQSPMQIVAIFMMMFAAFMLTAKPGQAPCTQSCSDLFVNTCFQHQHQVEKLEPRVAYTFCRKAIDTSTLAGADAAGCVAFCEDTAAMEQAAQKPSEFWHGVIPNLGGAAISGLAAGICQKALQGAGGRNSYVFTMELCVYQTISILFSFGFSIFSSGFFSGWTIYTPLPILCNAMGGIFTGQVVKYAGGVKKGFAVIAALIVTSFLQFMYYGTSLTMQLWIALPIVVCANLIYGRYPYVDPNKK